MSWLCMGVGEDDELAAREAERQANALLDVISSLGDSPEGKGRAAPQFGCPELRQIAFEELLIVYRIRAAEHRVEVINLLLAPDTTPGAPQAYPASTKEFLLEVAAKLLPDATLWDVICHLSDRDKVEKGLAALASGPRLRAKAMHDADWHAIRECLATLSALTSHPERSKSGVKRVALSLVDRHIRESPAGHPEPCENWVPGCRPGPAAHPPPRAGRGWPVFVSSFACWDLIFIFSGPFDLEEPQRPKGNPNQLTDALSRGAFAHHGEPAPEYDRPDLWQGALGRYRVIYRIQAAEKCVEVVRILLPAAAFLPVALT